MTEALCTHMTPKNGEQIGWTGPPLINSIAKVINVTTGEALPPHTDGEICVKSPSVSTKIVAN